MDDGSTRATILGQLALRSRKTYDLVKEMRRNLHYFWPRAESRIYATLKKLELSGEATQHVESTGKRTTGVWEITPTGHDAFRAWLTEAPTPTSLDCEALVRIFLAPGPDHAAVRASIQHLRDEAEELLADADQIASEYAEGRAPFQDRVRVRALVFDFLTSWAGARIAWADRAEQFLDGVNALPEADGAALAISFLSARHAAVHADLSRPRA